MLLSTDLTTDHSILLNSDPKEQADGTPPGIQK